VHRNGQLAGWRSDQLVEVIGHLAMSVDLDQTSLDGISDKRQIAAMVNTIAEDVLPI